MDYHEIRKAVEKQKAKKVPDIKHFGRCPECDSEFNSELLDEYNIDYCPWCGQHLDWREEGRNAKTSTVIQR